METREIFRNFPFLMQIAFYIIAFSASIVFLFGFYRRYKKYRRGRDAGRFNNIIARFGKAAAMMASNRTIFKRDRTAGFAHLLIFWGFIFLLIGTTIVAIDHDFLRFFGIHLLEGNFYLGFSAVLDLFGLLFIVGLIMMMFRRATRPPQLDYTRADESPTIVRKGYSTDDMIFMWLLLLIGISGFVIEGARIAADRPAWEVWSPVGWVIADTIDMAGFNSSANDIHLYTWWLHAVLVMFFIAYIPFSKAMHMLVDYANLMFKDDMAAKKLPGVSEERQKVAMGYQKIEDFTWKELLDFDSCTKCGRCHVACPAQNAGTELSPRDVILDLRTLVNESTGGVAEWFTQVDTSGKEHKAIAGGTISKDALWACTSCMACVEACPVGIEHLTSIVNLRRQLVEEGDMEDMLMDSLENIGEYGNSFGQSERMRAKWTSELDFKIKDARKEEAEYLWFVGDYASYDPRIQGLSRKVASIMNNMGVDYGILYDGEKNSGNDVRRVGEEGLYEMLVEDNVAAFEEANFKEIFTTDPHSYNTIKNEYPEFGAEYPIYHYTGLLLKLYNEGKLTFPNQLNYKVTYHDPCRLGRLTGIYDAPRELLEAIPGIELIEMPRARENGVCCGTSGWMNCSSCSKEILRDWRWRCRY